MDEYSISSINKFAELKDILNEAKMPYEVCIKPNEVHLYLAFPSVEKVKCIVDFDMAENKLDLLGQNFVCWKNITSIFPIEENVTADVCADRIFEDEWENYPIDESLKMSCENFFAEYSFVKYNN